LVDNTFSVSEATITPTPTPTDVPDNCTDMPDIIIEGNGAGSHNEIDIDISCRTEIHQVNESIIENNISITSSTGGNDVIVP